MQRFFCRFVSHWKYRECPFELLKATKDCSPKRLKTQFYQLSQDLHPDRTLKLSEKERKLRTDQFIKLQAAYDLLKDPVSRSGYLERSSSARYPQSNPYRNRTNEYTYQQPGDEKMMDDVQIWVFGFVFLGFVYFIMTRNYARSQEREQLIAWSVYNAKRRHEGLEGVVASSPDEIVLPSNRPDL
jgi:DnaJ-class molecular chaperone